MVIDISDIRGLVEPHGLVVLGVVDQTGPNREFSLILVGNTGSAVWAGFVNSAEYADGEPDPLDRWSRRIGEAVAVELNAEAIFPFEGPPYPPFLDWARESQEAFPSPLAMFIHRKHGLWHAYRFALRVKDYRAAEDRQKSTSSPCLSCIGQPCLDACPAGAFSGGQYRVDDCMGYLAVNSESGCRERGCRARKACPVAVHNQYHSEHARYHMDAFVNTDILRKQTVTQR